MTTVGVGIKEKDGERKPSPAAQASSGSEVCEDVDGAQVSDDGDGTELPRQPSSLMEGGGGGSDGLPSQPLAPDPLSVQLQVGEVKHPDATQITGSSDANKSRPLDPRLPLEVTVPVPVVLSQSETEHGATLKIEDQQTTGAPSESDRPRVFSCESLDASVEEPRTIAGHGFTVPVSLRELPDAHDTTPPLSRAPSLLQPGASIPHTHATSPTSSSSSNSWNNRGKSNSSLRRGKWTMEEEAYVARVIQDFNSGFLDAPAGTTLRTYLSEKLKCDPMRITKKFTGDSCIGKRVFHPAVRSPGNAAAIDKAQLELDGLERRWRRRLEMQQRDHAKKAAASAAAAAAATGRPLGLDGQASSNPNVVTQTASWLDRAKSVLKDPSLRNAGQEKPQDMQSLPRTEIMTQMQEVERLIHEGPIIQHSSAGLPHIVDQVSQEVVISPTTARLELEPADKRMRTDGEGGEGAEDAEALVGFLRSVRASAKSGQES